MYAAIIASTLAGLAIAAPTKRQATAGGPGDAVVLQYALTLEHLENAFYKEALAKFTLADFQAIGLDNVFYENLKEQAFDEATHVEFLSTALAAAGATPVVPNEYKFPYTDAASFLALSKTLEGVGVSAYLGAAQFIADATYLTVAGSILTVEARHDAYIRASQYPNQLSPFPSPFDTPMSINEVYTLASQFITKDNNPNANLPVKAFTVLSYAGGPAAIGSTITVTAASAVQATEAYFLAVTGPIKAGLSGSGTTFQVTIPEGTPKGQSYVVLTSGGVPTDSNTVAGPAIVEVQDNQYGVVRDVKPCTSTGGSGSGSGSAPSYGSGSSSTGSGSSSSGSAPSYSSGSGSSTSSGSSSGVKQIGDGQVQVYPSSGSSTSGASTTKTVVEPCESSVVAPAPATYYV